MKYLIIFTTLFATILLASQLLAGGDYYWAGNKKISITPDYSSFVIVFKKEKLYKNIIATYEMNKDIMETMISGDQRLAVLQFQKEKIETKIEILTYLNFTTKDIEWYSFGYKLNDVTLLRPTNRISFKLKTGYTQESLDKFMKGKAVFDHTHFGTLMIKANNIEMDIVSLANEIYESGITDYCLPDFIANIERNDDPLYSQQYFLNHTGQFGGNSYDFDIETPEAWEVSKGSSTIKVAVIDDGIEIHDDLKDANGYSRIVGGFTPHTGGDGNPSLPEDGHGEACTGIITATHNNINTRGVAPNVSIIRVNIFAPGTSEQEVADGINWACNSNYGNADVLSNSWGYIGPAGPNIYVPQIANAISNARINGRGGKGCVVVFAAGNNYPSDRYGYGPPGYISFPAGEPGVLCVSASNYSGNIASYSSRGSRIDITALGGENDIRTLDRMGSNGYNSGNDMTDFGGTSAACPQVSGVAALILSVNPNLTEQQVREII
ncbi:MAG: peptidase S8, partial [Bacteroidetes bacterium]